MKHLLLVKELNEPSDVLPESLVTDTFSTAVTALLRTVILANQPLELRCSVI